MEISRRALLLSAAAASEPNPIDTHIHLFDPKRFPYHPNASYKPPEETLDKYGLFAAKVLSHAVVVHPEPYQDDHSYLEYCFQNEPRKGFFKGTCLFDAFDPKTPSRMADLTKKWPNRIVALRVHATEKQPRATGPIRDRDLADPRMAQTWAAAAKLGLAIQMHMIPMWAPAVANLINQTNGVKVVIDHLCRYSQGTPAEYEEVLKLGANKGVYMKFSGPIPQNPQALCKKIHQAYGPGKIIWGGLGMNEAAYEKQRKAFDDVWSYLTPADRQKIKHDNAAKLYRLS